MKRSGLFLMFLTILLLCHGAAFGENVIYPDADTYVNSRYYSNQTELNTGNQQYGNNLTYIHFNLQNENAPTDIVSAKLILYNRKVNTTIKTGTVSVYRVKKYWTEGSISWNSKPPYPDPYNQYYVFVTSATITDQLAQDEIEFDLTELYRYWKANPSANFGIMLDTDGSTNASCGLYGCYPGTFYSKEFNGGSMAPRLNVMPLVTNNPPEADAGENLTVASTELYTSIVTGTATDPDGDSLEYRWLLDGTALMEWTAVPEGGEAELDLSTCESLLSVKTHTLTLAVRDGELEASDTMQLTVGNSPPTVAASGAGVFNYGDPVDVGAMVSDYDGDTLYYEWFEGDHQFCTSTQPTVWGGDPVELPACTLTDLEFGVHELTLSVSDGTNDPVLATIRVEMTDMIKPTLAPVASRQILWPPNHRWKRVVIYTNASDNMGGPVTLNAVVSSNEADSGLWRCDRGPDWTEPWIRNGKIYVWLRAERSPRGEGRVYSIDITAEDETGNFSEAQVTVMVPHDRGKQAQHRIEKLKKRLQQIWSHRSHYRWHRR